MKFIIKYSNSIEQKKLTYLADECSFDIEPTIHEINFDVVINKLNLTVAGDDNRIVQVWGFCPYSLWIKANYNVPQYARGILKVATDLKPGFAYAINNDSEWPVYVNAKTGWICIGNPEKSEKAVEFITDCVAVVYNGELVALWLKPQSLPKIK